jgi:hypothetical protein
MKLRRGTNMHRKLISALLTIVLTGVCGSVTSRANSVSQTQRTAKVKASIAKVGTGPTARVKIKLVDSTKLEGHVLEAREDSFDLVDKTGKVTTITYQQVQQTGGGGLSTAAKFAIGIPLALGGIILTGVLLNAGRD